MMKMKKTWIFVLFVLVFSFSGVVVSANDSGNANSDSRSYYTYDYWGNVLASAPAYLMSRELSYSDLGLANTSQFASVDYSDDKIYIADTGLNAVHIVDYDFNLIKTIDVFLNNGAEERFKTPKAVCVDHEDNIYVADSGNARIVQFNPDYTLKRIIGKPDHLALEELTFVPIDIDVNYYGRIYVIGENVYYGIMELNEEGEFLRFVGTNKVKVSFLQLFYRAIMSVEQRDYASLILPQEFRSVSVDEKGFIYATSYTQKAPIKRINTDGNDILVKNWHFEPVGDVDRNVAPSEFNAISATDAGIYAALDRTAGRIFVYNCDGEMLYVLGGIQRQNNYFLQPVDICWMKNDDICVIDAKKSSVIIFAATPFGQAVNQAARYHYEGLYEEALKSWELARKFNANYDLAYVGIGKAYLYTEEYYKAMKYFKLGNNRDYYSKAFSKYSAKLINDNFEFLILGVAVIIAALFAPKIIKRYKKRTKEQEHE